MTFNDIFKSSFLENVTSVSFFDMTLALLLAFGLGLFILLIYKKTFTGVMYSSSFGVTLLALTMITTLVILAVTSNVVLSLGMVGALSIVRFRTAVKEPLDIAFLFWSIAVGNETGRDADGLDSNGDIHIEGGNLFISVNTSSCALDCGSENGGVCDISGGTVIAAGGSNMAEGFSSNSEQCFIMRTTAAQADTAIALRDTEGQTLLSGTVPCAFSSLVLSTPELELNQTCILAIGDTEETVTADNTVPTGGFAGAFGGGGRPDFSGQGAQDRPQGMPGSMDRPQGMPNDIGGPPSFDRQRDARPAMGGMRGDADGVPPEESTALPAGSLPALAASIAVLAAGLAFALLFRRR